MAEKQKSSFPKYKHRQVTTPRAVARFPKVHEPDDYKGQVKFKIGLVFDGDVDLAAVNTTALEVAAEVYPTRKADKVNVLIKEGDDQEKDGEPIAELAGKRLINANCGEKHPPLIVGPDRKPLAEGVEVRNGDIVKAILAPIPSDTPIKGSIAFRLLGVQLIEKRSGGGNLADGFSDEGEAINARPSSSNHDDDADGGDAGYDSDDDIPF